MAVVGTSTQWADLIDPMVPVILNLVIESWQAMKSPASDEREDDITIALCRALKQNRTARDLMFQIDTQGGVCHVGHVEVRHRPVFQSCPAWRDDRVCA